MTTKTSPPIKSYETIDIEFNLNDRVLHWSPNGKYVCYSTNKHIFVMNMNTTMLTDPNSGCFQTVQSIEVNKTHGVQSLNKMMPLKYFYRLLPMDDMTSLVCNPLVCGPLFTDNMEIKKLMWSLSCSFPSEQNLLGALNSLGSLEVLSCSSSSQLHRVSNISHLWYAHCHKAYFKKYPLPKSSKQVRNIYLNFARLLFIDSFVWIPSRGGGPACELVCYHRLGVLSVWNFVETRDEGNEKEEIVPPPEIVKKTTPNKTSKAPPPPPPPPPSPPSDGYCYKCKLVKVITNYCIDPPFSVKRLFESEMKSSRARVLNVDHVRLGESKHCLSVSKDDGTIDLLAFEHIDVRTSDTMDTSFRSNVNATGDKHVKANDTVMDMSNTSSNDGISLDTDVNNASLDTTKALNKQDTLNSIANGTEKESIATEIENASLVNKGMKRTSSCKENDVVVENTELAPLEEETIKVNSTTMSEHLEVNKINGTTLEDEVNNEDQRRLGDEKVAKKRKRHSSANVEEVRNKKMKLSDEDDGENELNGAENELERNMSNEVGKTDDISSTNENGSKENGTNARQVENEPKKNKREIGDEANTRDNRDLSKTKTILNERKNSTRNNGNLEPAKYVVYDKTDNILVSNLMVSYIDDNVLIVFSKLSFICYVLLDKEGQVLESNQIKIRTRCITAMVKFVKNKYFVVTFESKVLVVSIGRLGGRDGRRTEIGLDSNENGMTRERALDPNENSMTRDSICVRNATLNESIQSGHEESIGNTNAKTGENKLDTTNKGESTLNVINKVISTDSSSSCKHITIVVRKIIDLSNPTHTINGIANSTNNFLTVLSFRIKVKFETYFKSSRNPSQLALTSFQSASRFLSSQLPNQSSPVYKQIDMMKFITLNNVNFFRLNSICMSLQNVQLKYFIVKLFKPKQQSEGKKSHFTQVLEQLENTIFLNHIKKCVRDGIFREDHQVLFLFREWTKRTFPADKHDLKKLTSCFPTEEYNELCVICSSKIAGVESLHYAVCSAKHRVLRCSLSLLQCLGSFVQCQYCSVFASKKYAANARCVFCDASFPVN